MENPIKIDDLGVTLFSETSICILFPSFLLVKRWLKFVIQPLEILDKPWGPWVKKGHMSSPMKLQLTKRPSKKEPRDLRVSLRVC